MQYDAIVIGAGAAGCVAARSLADRGWSVLLLEAGPGGPVPPALTAIDATAALGRPERFWPGSVAVTTAGTEIGYRQGLGLGGGSAVNTLVAMVGDIADYDRWAGDLGCEGWTWASMAPWIDAAVATWPAETVELGPLARGVGAAASAAGHRTAGASVEPDLRGFAPAVLMTLGGRRRSAADAFLAGAPAGLRVEADAPVARIGLRAGRATGVELLDGRSIAAGRVVVAAGALRTPRLLAASGLLPAGEAGRPVQDHPSFVFSVELEPHARHDQADRAPVSAVLRWSTGSGPAAPLDATAIVMDHVGPGPDGRRYGAVIVELTDVESLGRLDPTAGEPLRFEPGWLAASGDRIRFREAVGHVAELLARSEVAAVARHVAIDDEGTGLDTLRRLSGDELDHWLITHPGPVSHAASTCAIGPSPANGAVVGLDGAVFGHRGVSVVDASLLPRLPGVGPQVPVMAVAARLASGLA